MLCLLDILIKSKIEWSTLETDEINDARASWERIYICTELVCVSTYLQYLQSVCGHSSKYSSERNLI